MILYASAPSPYSRKVRIALIELGLADRVTVVAAAPMQDPAFRRINPLGKIPALRINDSSIVIDSLVIIDWLDHVAGGGRLIPSSAPARNLELRGHVLADGIIDAAFAIMSERRRPEAERSASWIARWAEAIEAAAEQLPTVLPGTFGLAALTAATAADYVDFRLGDLGLNLGRLGEWRSALPDRDSLTLTAPEIELT